MPEIHIEHAEGLEGQDLDAYTAAPINPSREADPLGRPRAGPRGLGAGRAPGDGVADLELQRDVRIRPEVIIVWRALVHLRGQLGRAIARTALLHAVIGAMAACLAGACPTPADRTLPIIISSTRNGSTVVSSKIFDIISEPNLGAEIEEIAP